MPDEPAQRYSPQELHTATRLMRTILSAASEIQLEMYRKLSVNPVDFRALEVLMQWGEMSQTELAGHLGTTAAGTSAIVDRLEALNHVERSRDTADRRRVLVRTTQSSASRAMGELMPMILTTDDVVRALPDHDQEVVVDYLTSSLAAMRHRLAEMRTAVAS